MGGFNQPDGSPRMQLIDILPQYVTSNQTNDPDMKASLYVLTQPADLLLRDVVGALVVLDAVVRVLVEAVGLGTDEVRGGGGRGGQERGCEEEGEAVHRVCCARAGTRVFGRRLHYEASRSLIRPHLFNQSTK